MKTKIISLLVISATLFSCNSTKKATPIPPTPPNPSISLSSKQAEGKTIYENNCGKCHRLYAPYEFFQVEWAPILEKMQPKAKITDDQKAKILSYLTLK